MSDYPLAARGESPARHPAVPVTGPLAAAPRPRGPSAPLAAERRDLRSSVPATARRGILPSGPPVLAAASDSR